MSKHKRVRWEEHPSSDKSVKIIENPDSFYDQTPVWSFSRCDFESERWSMCDNEDCLAGLMKRLKAFEGMKWRDILLDKSGRRNNTKNHSMPVSHLCREAQKRYYILKLDEYPEIYSLTVTGKQRLFGVLDDNVFSIIWFDKNHQICPCH